MNVEALADERNIALFAEALPADGLHHVTISVVGVWAPASRPP